MIRDVRMLVVGLLVLLITACSRTIVVSDQPVQSKTQWTSVEFAAPIKPRHRLKSIGLNLGVGPKLNRQSLASGETLMFDYPDGKRIGIDVQVLTRGDQFFPFELGGFYCPGDKISCQTYFYGNLPEGSVIESVRIRSTEKIEIKNIKWIESVSK